MSELKKQAKLLKEKAKGFGYEIKHTHALELISQINHGVNRHASLNKEKYSENNFFALANDPAIKLPFGVEKHVIELFDGELFQYYVTSNLGLMFEEIYNDEIIEIIELSEFLYNIESFKVLSKKDLEKKITQVNFYGESLSNPRKLFDLILEKAKKTGLENFSLFTEYS